VAGFWERVRGGGREGAPVEEAPVSAGSVSDSGSASEERGAREYMSEGAPVREGVLSLGEGRVSTDPWVLYASDEFVNGTRDAAGRDLYDRLMEQEGFESATRIWKQTGETFDRVNASEEFDHESVMVELPRPVWRELRQGLDRERFASVVGAIEDATGEFALEGEQAPVDGRVEALTREVERLRGELVSSDALVGELRLRADRVAFDAEREHAAPAEAWDADAHGGRTAEEELIRRLGAGEFDLRSWRADLDPVVAAEFESGAESPTGQVFDSYEEGDAEFEARNAAELNAEEKEERAREMEVYFHRLTAERAINSFLDYRNEHGMDVSDAHAHAIFDASESFRADAARARAWVDYSRERGQDPDHGRWQEEEYGAWWDAYEADLAAGDAGEQRNADEEEQARVRGEVRDDLARQVLSEEEYEVYDRAERGDVEAREAEERAAEDAEERGWWAHTDTEALVALRDALQHLFQEEFPTPPEEYVPERGQRIEEAQRVIEAELARRPALEPEPAREAGDAIDERNERYVRETYRAHAAYDADLIAEGGTPGEEPVDMEDLDYYRAERAAVEAEQAEERDAGRVAWERGHAEREVQQAGREAQQAGRAVGNEDATRTREAVEYRQMDPYRGIEYGW
jgi:hypothetical protein